VEQPDPNIVWRTKKGINKYLREMDYNHLKNSRNMLQRGNKTHLSIYRQLDEEIKYREWKMAKEKNQRDDDPTSRFDLIDFD